MIPLKIHRPKSRFPTVTYSLIVLNVVVFALTYYSREFDKIVDLLAFKLGPRALWTWFTSIFLHANWMHLIGNMVFLYVFGSLIENVISRFKYILLYLVGALTSTFVQALVYQVVTPSKIEDFAIIGASGAIFALLGIVMIRFRKNQVTWYVITPLFLLELMVLPGNIVGPIGVLTSLMFFTFILVYGFMHDVPIWQLATVWPVFTITALATGLSYLFMQFGFGMIQIAEGQVSGVAYWAHIGGILGGIAMIKFLGISKDASKEYLVQDAKSLSRQGRYKDAALKYEELLSKGKQEIYYIHKCAKNWALAGQIEKSKFYFQKAFSEYYHQGKKEEASQVYDDIQNLLPNHYFDPKLELKFASLCQAQYKLEAALKGFEKITERAPKSQEAELALLRIAQVYQKMGETNKARLAYLNFLDKYPDSRWISLASQMINQQHIKPA